MSWIAALAVLIAMTGAAFAEDPMPLVGSLKSPALWQAYKQRFIAPEGRVVDNANNGISHSEGQGYGMLLAVAADDAPTFELLWSWTRAQLMMRDDGLAAWQWEPSKTPHVRDRNNASDGDVLLAWALAEAGQAWSLSAYKTASLRMMQAIVAADVVHVSGGPVLMPGHLGFAVTDRADGPVINISYWVFPALARFAVIAPDQPWAALTRSGLQLLAAARFGPKALPTDWISLSGDLPKPAKGFPPTFGYDAIRIPLYVAWAGLDDPERLAPFLALYGDPQAMPQSIDVNTGRPLESMADSGYAAIGALVRCAARGEKLPVEFTGVDVDRYYPSTLRALVLVAINQRYPQCL